MMIIELKKLVLLGLQGTYETDRMSLLHDTAMSNAFNFVFLMYFIVV